MWQARKMYKTIGTNMNRNEQLSLYKGSIQLEQKVRKFAAILSGLEGRFVFPYVK